MLRKINALLSAVVHTYGRLLYLSVELGPLRTTLWIGRDNPDTVRFAAYVDLDYGAYFGPSLDVGVEVGIIKAEFFLMRSSSE